MATLEDLRETLTGAKPNATIDLQGEVFDLNGGMIDERFIDVPGVVISNFVVKNGTVKLRALTGWSLTDFEFDNACLAFAGGIGWSLMRGEIHDTSSMAQLSIVEDDYFGTITTPAAWFVRGVNFLRQSIDGPSPGSDPTQNHGIYCHSIQEVAMHGKIIDCGFEDHPYGSNLKLGGTHAFSGVAKDVDVMNCTFKQSDLKGGNILLVASSTARFSDCKPVDNNPTRFLTANGPVQASFERSPFTGVQVASMAEKYVTQTFWFFGPRSFTYKVPWYSPHSEFKSAPAGTSIEGIRWL